MFSFYELLWIFFLYAFLGWCSEVIFAAVKTGEFVNRGFLLGPVCPIYGLGVAFVLLLLMPLEENLLILYAGSVIITSALEYLVGWLAEKLLHQRLWDYSDMPFNLKGYICLAFSLVWGVACVLVVRVIQPLILGLIHWIPYTLGLVLLALFSATFLTDLILTCVAAAKLPKQIRAAEELERLIRSVSDNIGESLYNGVARLDLEEKKEAFSAKREALDAKNEALRQELEEKLAAYRAMVGKNRTYLRLTKAFPHLKRQRYHRGLETIRAYIAQKEHKSHEQD